MQQLLDVVIDVHEIESQPEKTKPMVFVYSPLLDQIVDNHDNVSDEVSALLRIKENVYNNYKNSESHQEDFERQIRLDMENHPTPGFPTSDTIVVFDKKVRIETCDCGYYDCFDASYRVL